MVFVSSPRKAPAELPPPPWSSKRAKSRTRAPLTRAAITDAALHLIDQEGLEQLSMRRLAEALETAASALYAHVSGKAELLQLVLDRVAGEVEMPELEPARWTDQLKQLSREMRSRLAAHRDLAAANLGNIPTGHNMLAIVDNLLGMLRAGGLSNQTCAYAADLVPLFVTTSTYEHSLFAEREPAYFTQLDDYLRALPASRFPNLAHVIDEISAPDESPDARFEFGLEVIVRGLASMASEPAAAAAAKRRPRAKRPGRG